MMSESLLFLYVLLIIVVFLLLPTVGVIAMIRDVRISRKKGRELRLGSELAHGIRTHFTLRSEDLAGTKATLSNYLEQFSHGADSDRIRNQVGLISQCQAIMLGETSRRALQTNSSYRLAALLRIARLTRAIEMHSDEEIMRRTGDLLALSLSHGNPIETTPSLAIDPKRRVVAALNQASASIVSVPYLAKNTIDETLLEVGESPNATSAGLPLLILKWAQINMVGIERRAVREAKSLDQVIKDLSHQFSRIARAYERDNVTTIANIIYGSS